jgi:hypothetical protein
MITTIRSPSQPVSFGAADHADDAERHIQGQLGKIRLTCNCELEAEQDPALP